MRNSPQVSNETGISVSIVDGASGSLVDRFNHRTPEWNPMTSEASKPQPKQFPDYGSHAEATRIGTILRKETVGGGLLVAFAAIAIIWANTPWAEAYFAMRDFEVGIEALGLKLSLGTWAADGLLAIFFFLVGLELKKEFVVGDLRQFKTAVVPIAAAFGGVAVPALTYLAIAGRHEGLSQGWAIPTATDIAFAVAVLAIIGSHLPSPLRIFLLTLAVVDDLIAISIIAIFYTDEIQFMPLGASVAIIIAYGVLAHLCRTFFATRMWAAWLILLPLGMLAWVFMHESGVHATIAGVLLGFAVPVFAKRGKTDAPGEPDAHGLAEEFEHRFRPLSAGVAVPIFAFFAAGVSVGGAEGFIAGFTEPVTIAIMAALILGKPIGIAIVTFIANKAMGRSLDPSYKWVDVIGVGFLAGIGFTVSLLVTELSFSVDDPAHDLAKAAVLKASVLAAILAGALLSVRNRHYRKIAERDAVDADSDGVPDVYQRDRD